MTLKSNSCLKSGNHLIVMEQSEPIARGSMLSM